MAGRHRRQRLHVPTRIVFGRRDLYITPRLLRGGQPYADDLIVELVPGCGHFIADERPDLVAARAGALFTDAGAGRRPS